MAEPGAFVTLFAGPSACGLADALFAGIARRPPVRRGDVDALLQAPRAPGVIVLCDGVFQAEPAVSHGEICRALDAGWRVWGVASLGAIRAHEMRFDGVQGHGYVYAQFGRYEDFTDDELCLLHFPAEPFFPVTEALVNLRYALEQRGAALGIAAAAQARTIAALAPLWFGERSEARMRAAMVDAGGIAPAAADALLAWLRGHRIKTLDLAALLSERPWLAGR